MESSSGSGQQVRPKYFIDAWLAGQKRRFDCVVDLAEQATDDPAAKMALKNLAENAMPEDGVLSVDCQKQACNGCVRLIMENAGLEAVDCAVRGASEQQTS